MKSRLVATLMSMLLLGAAGLVWLGYRSSQSKAPHCAVCMRPIHSGMATAYRVGDKPEEACCVACVFAYSRQTGQKVTVDHVTDYGTGEHMSPERATFVVGGNLHPCSQHDVVMDETKTPYSMHYDRCLPSVIAFHDADRAQAFAREHRGTLQKWDQVVASLTAPVVSREKNQ